MLRLHEGPFNPDKHKLGYLRKKLSHYLPYYAIGTNKLSQYLHATKEERRLLERYEQLSNFLATDYDCYKKYLDYCHSLDYYGCAFFRGTCYQKVSDYKIWKSDQLPITLGVNRYGITLFQGRNYYFYPILILEEGMHLEIEICQFPYRESKFFESFLF